MKQLQDPVLREVGALFRSVHALYDAKYRSLDLQRGQFIFLTRICERPGIRQTDLATLLRVDKTTVAKVVPKFLRNGYLIRKRDEHDGRVWRLYPTPRALELYDLVIEEENRSARVCFAGFSAGERAAARSLLRRMRQNCEADLEAYRKRQKNDQKSD